MSTSAWTGISFLVLSPSSLTLLVLCRGTCLPLFRSRIVAGVVVSIAASVAILTVHWFARNVLYFDLSVFSGCAMGFAYAVLFWKYESDGEQGG